MQKEEIKKMFENAVHIGHRTQKWNPRMKKYIHGERNGIHIINLEKTYEMLEKALAFLSKSFAENKTVLFVSTKPQSVKLLEELARDCSMPYVVSKWIPGLLTNFTTIKSRTKYLADLKRQVETGEISKYTKKEVSKMKKIMDKLQIALGGVQNMTSKPDVVFVVDALRDKIVVKEARRMKIPVVGIVDTNADPSGLTYPIPGNDDAIKSLTYFLDTIKGVFKKAKNK